MNYNSIKKKKSKYLRSIQKRYNSKKKNIQSLLKKDKTQIYYNQFNKLYSIDKRKIKQSKKKQKFIDFNFDLINFSKYNNKLLEDDILKANIANFTYYNQIDRPLRFSNFAYDIKNSTKKIAVYFNKFRVIIGFRGTKPTSRKDLYTDIYVGLNKMSNNKYIKIALENFINIINYYRTQNKKYIFEITGHSLGGSITLFINSLPEYKFLIKKNTIFNPGITVLSLNTSVLKTYAKNKKNRFIVKYGDPISNGILRYQPKNVVLLVKPLSKNPLTNHSLNVFLK